MTVNRLIVSGALLVVLAGCSASNAGSPVAQSSSTPTNSQAPGGTTNGTTVTPTSRLLPPRPRDLDLTGVDPCKDVLTQDQLHQLAYDLGYQRQPRPGTIVTDNGRTCTFSSSRPTDQPSRDIGSLIIITTSSGADVWLTDPSRKRSADLARKATIAGFPALVLPNPSFEDDCVVAVDVHDGQYLGVSSSPSGGATGASPEPYCAEAQRVADMAIQTLLVGR